MACSKMTRHEKENKVISMQPTAFKVFKRKTRQKSSKFEKRPVNAIQLL